MARARYEDTAPACCYNCSGPCRAVEDEKAREKMTNRRKEKKTERKAGKLKAQLEAGGANPQPQPSIQEAAKAGPPAVIERRDLVLAGTPEKEKDPNYRRVSVIPDHHLDYPDLWMTVFIADTCQEPAFAEMFTRASCYRADTVDEADLVVFTGGPDVDPILYGEKPHPKVNCSKTRDDRDMEVYVECLKKGIPMLGICRGAQFLHVMQGGKLWQHVDGHTGEHSMRLFGTSEVISRVSSTHHQMVRPHNKMEVLATADKATEKWAGPGLVQRQKTIDIEAFFYADPCILGIQGHPEYKGYNRFTLWVLQQIERWVQHNPNVTATDGVYRLKKRIDIVDAPKEKEKEKGTK